MKQIKLLHFFLLTFASFIYLLYIYIVSEFTGYHFYLLNFAYALI